MLYRWEPMGHRFVGPSPFPRLVLAVVVVAAGTAVAVVLSRSAAPGSASATQMDGSRSDRTDLASTTASTVDSIPSSSTSAVPTTQPSDTPFERDDVYRWLWVDPADIRFVWRGDDGVAYGQLQSARAALENRGERVLAITNGGIHRPDLIPSGLYVEEGVEMTPLNRGSGSGNFFLQPNGVFWIDDERAGIDTTEAYAVVERTVDAAVQSGPMLVIDSQINPAFSESSTSTHRRNAVGVDANGRALLIMADRAVTLWAMADRCRELGAVDALYLDGTLSRLEHVVDGRPIFPNLPVASMIAVVDSRTAPDTDP